MQVLFLNHFFRCGQSVHVEMLAKGLVKKGHKVSLFFNNNFKLLKKANATVEAFRIHLATLTEAGVNVLGKLPERVDSDTIIHSHSALTWRKGLALAKENSCPFVVTIHGLGLDNYVDVMQEADLVLAVAECFANPYRELVDNIIVLSNAVELDIYKPKKKQIDKRVITYLGRFAESKYEGLLALNKALIDLKQKIPLEARIVGNIPYGIFEESDSIKTFGWQIDRAYLLGDSDIVIGTGMAIREGMASANVGYVMGKYVDGLVRPEFLNPVPEFTGQESLVVPTSDMIHEQLFSIFQDVNELRQLQSRSYLFAKRYFDFNDYLKDIVTYYGSIIE